MGEGRNTKLQLNDAANGWKFARPDVTSAGLPLLPQGGEGERGGRKGGVIY